MDKLEVEKLNDEMLRINAQLNKIADSLSDAAAKPDGPSKQRECDRIIQNQDVLLKRAEIIRERLRIFGAYSVKDG